jgi:hypothetical protein
MLSILDSKFAWLDHSYFLLRNKIFNKDEPLLIQTEKDPNGIEPNQTG